MSPCLQTRTSIYAPFLRANACRVTSPNRPDEISHFATDGQPSKPEIYSNKVVLTPISPGNHRASLWGLQTLDHREWMIDVEFRASGPERGGGNMNVWLVDHGDAKVGMSSIYTVGKFDGLALVVDQHGGSGGMLRGFLNDGTVDYSQHHNVDQLAFGHCNYPYRNSGRPLQIKVQQTAESFHVEIDGISCFQSDQVNIPEGYKLGVTAATPETPDSFEVYKVTVMSQLSRFHSERAQQAIQDQALDGISSQVQGVPNDMADQDPNIFTTSKLQFADLHNRLQAARGQMTSIYRAVDEVAAQGRDSREEVKQLIAGLRSELASFNQVPELQRRVDGLEREIRGMRNDLNRKFQASERSVESYLKDHHATLSQAMADSMPSHGKLIFILVGSQAVLAVSYILYKRRRRMSAKKYL